MPTKQTTIQATMESITQRSPDDLDFNPVAFTDVDFAREVIPVPVATEMSESFLAYGLSVITARAIPDVRDGLKPVQRRILWSMLQMGLRPGTPFRKSARVVGDTMGRYHPHGDAAIYDALVRLGQDFGRLAPLVDPQGNFGSLDDPPAASRYTECRLTPAAMDMVGEVDEDTVDFRPTYDGEGLEPAVLPAAFPNLLVNGTSGIAVGMATNMAPHNLREVCDAIKLVLRGQSRGGGPATTDELLKRVPGPDFPGGGRVVDQGLRQICESGRGRVRVQASTSVERITGRRQAIVVTELPYLVGPERVLSWVNRHVESGRLTDVAGIADLSDMEGLRIQIDLKPGADPQAALAGLYRLTPLEETFSVNNVVLVDGVPTTVGLRKLCEHYIAHRLDVIVRRTRHRLEKAQRRLEVVEGLITALDHIDEVVALISGAQSPDDARQALMERFTLSETQAKHILDMPLRRLTALEKLKLLEEAAGLRSAIDDYHQTLASAPRRRRIVVEELDRIAKRHGAQRRSVMVSQHEADAARSVSGRSVNGPDGGDGDARRAGDAQRAGASSGPGRDTPCVVTVSTSGNLGRAPVSGARKAIPGRHDLIAARTVTSTASPVVLVTSAGRAFVLRAGEAFKASNRLRGAPVAPMLGLHKRERVLALAAEGDDGLVVVTAAGIVRRLTAAQALAAGYGAPVIALKPGDSVAAAFLAGDEADLIILADDAKALRVTAGAFVAGGQIGGAIGMKPREGAAVVFAGKVPERKAPERKAPDQGALVMATGAGGVKSTALSDIPRRGRGGAGVFAAKLASGDSVTAGAITSIPATSIPAASIPSTSITAASSSTSGSNSPRRHGPHGDAAWVTRLLALKARDDNPRRIDPRPVLVRVDVTRRYGAPSVGGRRIHALAPGRW